MIGKKRKTRKKKPRNKWNQQKRKTRQKKPRNKWNQLYFQPVECLNVILDGDRKRSGFHMYNELTCKICKSVFRNPFGLKIHSQEIHGENLDEKVLKSAGKKMLKKLRKDGEGSTSEDFHSEGDVFNEKWEEENLPVYRQACNQQKAHVKQIKDESIPVVEEINGGVFNGKLLTDKDVLSRTGWFLNQNQSQDSARVSQVEESDQDNDLEGCSSSNVGHVIKNESDRPSSYRSSLRSTRGNLFSDCRVDVERLKNWKRFEPFSPPAPTASTSFSPTIETVLSPTASIVLSPTSLTDPSLPTSTAISPNVEIVTAEMVLCPTTSTIPSPTAKIFIYPKAKKVPSPIAKTVFMDDKSIPVVEELKGGVFNGELLTDKGALSRTGWLLNQSHDKKKTESQRFDGNDNAIISQCDDRDVHL